MSDAHFDPTTDTSAPHDGAANPRTATTQDNQDTQENQVTQPRQSQYAPGHAVNARLEARDADIGYGDKPIIPQINATIPEGEFTVIVGPNGCGKSTLLRAFARMLKPDNGQILLDHDPIGSYKPKEVARRLSLLPQAPVAPEGIIVEDLVGRGRYPHQGVLRQWSKQDQEAVDNAMERARVTDLADRFVHELSGGQRQRVWVALVLAQQSPIVLLDEPTTYLDITHQVEVLNLARDMQREGLTVVAVLHELTLAFRYATNLIMMKEGKIVAEGPVDEIVTAELIEEVYELPCQIIHDPVSGRPIVVPTEQDERHMAPGQ